MLSGQYVERVTFAACIGVFHVRDPVNLMFEPRELGVELLEHL